MHTKHNVRLACQVTFLNTKASYQVLFLWEVFFGSLFSGTLILMQYTICIEFQCEVRCMAVYSAAPGFW